VPEPPLAGGPWGAGTSTQHRQQRWQQRWLWEHWGAGQGEGPWAPGCRLRVAACCACPRDGNVCDEEGVCHPH